MRGRSASTLLASGLHALFAFILVIFAFAAAIDPRTATFPPVKFDPPKAQRTVLPGGMVLYLLEDHELPLINVQVMFRTGDLYEPADRVGLAGITGGLMRTGGTRTMKPDQLDEELERMAAQVSVGIGEDAGFASLDLLAKDFDRVFSLFLEILMEPAFDPDRLELIKAQVAEAIRRRNDTPEGIVSRAFAKVVYGPESPYARESTLESIGRITRDDVVAFHRRYLHPNNMIVGISGDFDSRKMTAAIRRAFDKWSTVPVALPVVPPVPGAFTGSVSLIPRDIPQTTIRLGHLGITQKDPDFFALSVLNDILGGEAFTSRLFQDVRTRSGLAYSVGTALVPGMIDRGVFLIYCQTRPATTHRAIQAILEQVDRIRREEVTEEELRLAKDSFLNSFVFSFSSPDEIVGRQMSLEYYGLPADFLDRYRDNVARITRKEILEAARRHLHPDRLTIVAVGRPEEFDAPLDDFGPVHRVSIEDLEAGRVPRAVVSDRGAEAPHIQ